MKTLIRILLLAVALVGCGCARRYDWRERNEPTTEAERQAVATMIEKIMQATPRTLSGHDQDWDDAIAAATRSATNSQCRTTYWEYYWTPPDGVWHFTGRFHYAGEPRPPSP